MPARTSFHLAMADRAMVLKKGTQPNVALMARFPPEADEPGGSSSKRSTWDCTGSSSTGWTRPSRLDSLSATCGIRPGAIRSHRSQRAFCGSGPGNATWLWGLTTEEHERHADLWPLNPEGDLLATMMIESVEGLANVDQIAATPGVGSLFRKCQRPGTLVGTAGQPSGGRNGTAEDPDGVQGAQDRATSPQTTLTISSGA